MAEDGLYQIQASRNIEHTGESLQEEWVLVVVVVELAVEELVVVVGEELVVVVVELEELVVEDVLDLS